MTTEVRRLNERGLKFFSDYITRMSSGEKADPPFSILSDDGYSETVSFRVEVGLQSFSTRFEIGQYLQTCFRDIHSQQLLSDTGLWSWLALYWFDQLCPAKADGTRKPSRVYNYILSQNYNHRPRHALRTTWLLVDQYGETAQFLLSKRPSERGELLEQIAARQFLISCKGVIEAANHLYFDSTKNSFKRGSTSQKRKGSIRRFICFLQQLELTYDLYTLPGDTIISMLPT